MKICNACKSFCDDDAKFCENCGYSFAESDGDNGNNQNSRNEAYSQNGSSDYSSPKKFNPSQFLISVAAIVIVVAVSLWGGKLLAGNVGKSEIDDIQEYIDKISDYTPGVIADNTYTSEYWNMKVDFGSKWTCATEAELREQTDELRKTQLDSARGTAADVNASEALLGKYMESAYANVEFIATLKSGKKNATVFMNVIGLYGMDEISAKEMLDSICDSINSSSLNSVESVTTKTIGGNRFEVVNSRMFSTSGYYNNNIGIYKKDGIMAILYWVSNDEAKADTEMFVLKAISELN